ncbi:MAG: ribose 5-phosphate isomerase A [Hyphomicrobiales bacterium]|nr:MAG: ribose 5-phosphate isomerase A [Hyphomicrobiales bacterium]
MSDDLKRAAAAAALEEVTDGMKLGIGTGSTAEHFVRLLAEKVKNGLTVIGVPTSERTAKLAGELGIPLTTLDEEPELDLTIDGADEVDGALRLVKGGGGALLREKIVAAASKRMAVIVDGAKVVDALGAFPLPIEVNRFGLESTRRKIVAAATELGLDGPVELRRTADGEAFVTDGGHFILDASFRRIADPERLNEALLAIPGVVEHGLFIGLATLVFVARAEGTEILRA